jgi:hypothetical protein
MSDEEYIATLLAILTNPAPTGIDPADPYGRADDGIDRYDGFGREVRVVGLQVVDGQYGDELEVSFVLDLPEDPEWEDVPEQGVTRVPFDAEWRRLSEFDDPAAYAPQVALRVSSAAHTHAVEHQHGGRLARRRAEYRAASRAALPDRDVQRGLLLQTLAGEGEVVQVAADRFDLRLRSEADGDGVGGVAGPGVLDASPEVITFVLTPDEWEEVLVDEYKDDLRLYLAETLADPDPDERFVVFHDGSLHRSTREQLPPVRGRARERAWALWRSEHPLGPGDGWYAYDPNDRDRQDEPARRLPPQ